MNEDEAMSAYARGNAQAFEVVYDAVAPRLEGYLRKHVKDVARIDDIIQQTFLQMHAARGNFIDGAAVVPWAFQIAKRVAIDVRRKAQREECHDFSSDEDAHARQLASTEATAEQVVQARDAGKAMAAAIDRLSEPQRQALELRCQGMKGAEIAATLKTTITGVKLRLHRAFGLLRTALDDSDGWDASGSLATEAEEKDRP